MQTALTWSVDTDMQFGNFGGSHSGRLFIFEIDHSTKDTDAKFTSTAKFYTVRTA